MNIQLLGHYSILVVPESTTNALCWFPGSLLVIKYFKDDKIKTFFSVLSLILQASALIWPIQWAKENPNDIRCWSLSIGLFLTSFGWWECYLTEFGSTEWMWRIRKKMSDGLENDEEVLKNELD